MSLKTDAPLLLWLGARGPGRGKRLHVAWRCTCEASAEARLQDLEAKLEAARRVAGAACEALERAGVAVQAAAGERLHQAGPPWRPRGRRPRQQPSQGPGPGLAQPCSLGALDALAAWRGVEVSPPLLHGRRVSRDQVGRGGSSNSGHSGPCCSPPGGPWSCALWPRARPVVVGLAAGSGGQLPLRPPPGGRSRA